jgi:hypothetical protein
MMAALTGVERRIRWSAIFLLAGLAVEAASLLKVAALSFVVFTTVGLLLFAVGAALFLLSLLEAGPAEKT